MAISKFKSILTHNTFLKILSIILGFVIWITVTNTSNPEITETITIPFDVRNDTKLSDQGKSYSIDTNTVKVSYAVRTKDRKDIALTNFKAFVSLDEISITGAVPLHVETDQSITGLVSNISVTPMVVHVETDDMIQKPFTVDANTVGTPSEGKVVGKPVLNPSTVRLKGPSFEIGKIRRVGVEISVEGANEELTGAASLQFYDSNDNLLNLSSKVQVLDPVNYRVPIYYTKALSITGGAIGQPAPGYMLSRIEFTPAFVTVCGPKEVLDDCRTIRIPDSQLNIENATRNVTVSLNLESFLPDHVFLIESGEISVLAYINRFGNMGNHSTVTEGPGTQPDTEVLLEGPHAVAVEGEETPTEEIEDNSIEETTN